MSPGAQTSDKVSRTVESFNPQPLLKNTLRYKYEKEEERTHDNTQTQHFIRQTTQQKTYQYLTLARLTLNQTNIK